ncbi:MAG: type IX secretion system membrane protein PorP/SprF, partial [Bacteroidia bacterium]|nr:type IX secretion system membrane protein PorP/SprF [Bacteroidia bacterium]
MKKRILLIFISAIAFNLLKAQDPQFAQYYANPIFLNPAYTGLTYEHRMVVNYRNQWLGISKAYSTYAASYDYNANDIRSGLGIQVVHDVAGISAFKTTTVAGSYAYHANLDKFTEIRAGAALSLNFKRLNFDRLIFNDQLSSGAPVSVEDGNFFPKTYFDLNAGVLINSVEYWIGFSAKHLPRPDVSMSGSGANLPINASLHGGYRFVLEKTGRNLKKYFSPTFNYRHQGKYDQLDLGVYYYMLPLEIGLWYRGIPLKRYAAGFPNHDALSVLVGYEVQKYDLRIGYSYDLTLSKLIGSTSGSHELSIIYEI